MAIGDYLTPVNDQMFAKGQTIRTDFRGAIFAWICYMRILYYALLVSCKNLLQLTSMM